VSQFYLSTDRTSLINRHWQTIKNLLHSLGLVYGSAFITFFKSDVRKNGRKTKGRNFKNGRKNKRSNCKMSKLLLIEMQNVERKNVEKENIKSKDRKQKKQYNITRT
jgi:hypothetical protein